MSDNLSAQCHCGAVTFSVTLIDGLNTARRCNCSFCRMRGAVVVFASSVEVTKGKETLTEYRFNSRQVAHYFCSVCGIYTFHQSRSNPHQYAVNASCIEGVSPFDFACVNVTDGINHPKDGGAGGVIGELCWRPK
ncbi:GFA family protein [Erwinia sorbitola]|uniref:GFA family protein n=1 Tax=Erwinia sorbitola TaxID=2681984 RepID=A0A6I6ELQ8_9GAMM|nr:GFA family protein [Erwinia sorbitola]MTD25870.1 GFA family protein [Erwinia sorbitola]QGU87581.1 GFA family protein [Erwinia sorbitola]